jgi:hypothetical protein
MNQIRRIIYIYGGKKSKMKLFFFVRKLFFIHMFINKIQGLTTHSQIEKKE